MSKLKNPPLQEVILEVKWDLVNVPNSNYSRDPKYVPAIGRLKDRLSNIGLHFYSNRYPFEIGDHIPHQVSHQFWSSQNTHPVAQLGQGIFTLNHAADYDWDNFFPLLNKALRALIESYDGEITFSSINLKYIDSILANESKNTGWERFIHQNMKFSFHNGFDQRGPLTAFNFEQMFNMSDGKQLLISMASALNNETLEDLFIFQTTILESGHFTMGDALKWADDSHKIASGVFKNICSDELYRSFE